MTGAYLLNCSIIWALSLLLYLSLFRNKTRFSINRFFLLATLLAGLILPFIQMMGWLTVHSHSPLSQVAILTDVTSLAQIVPPHTEVTATPTENSHPLPYLLIVYILGFSLTSLRFVNGLWNIRKIHTNGTVQTMDNLSLITHDLDIRPFSFFNSIYLNKSELDNKTLASILSHERAHITGQHSIDIMFMELLKVLLWFHPFVYLYKKLIRETQEFIADSHACQTLDRKEYCLKLVQPETSTIITDLGNNFFGNNLKNRITMIHKKYKSNALLYQFVLPTFFCCLILISCQTRDYSLSPEYEVGAAVEKMLEENYFNASTIAQNGLALLNKYPSHESYIKNRIQKHFKSLGGEITFDENEIENLSQLEEKKIQSSLKTKHPLRIERKCFFMKAFDTNLSHLPTLIPIKESDLKKTVKPGPRMHPIKKVMKNHKGIDYVAQLGSPVHAAGTGLVTGVNNYERGYGNCIRIDHNAGMETFYAHLSEINVKKGDYVTKGEVIGKVGTTGLSTSPHLHFEILRDGQQWTTEVLTQTLE